MKWTNKGNQYDNIGNRFEGIKEIFIYGAGMKGEFLRGFFRFLKDINCHISFIDNDPLKQEKEILHTKVISFNEFLKIDKDKHIVIVSASVKNTKEMLENLYNIGYVNGIDSFDMDDFISLLPIFLVYHSNKVFFPSISFLPTTHCNLNCNACLNFNPYIKVHVNRDIEELKKDTDIFFNCIDYIDMFHISGGEPFLYPNLVELIEYIGLNYRSQIRQFTTTTNGTLIPSDNLCKALKKYNSNVILDDYSHSVKKSKDSIQKLTEKLTKYDIDYIINKAEFWIDLAPLTTDNSKYSDEQLLDHYKKCENPFQELREGKIYSCNYSSYAMKAGLHLDNTDEYYDLTKHKVEKNKELVEFRLRYNNKGYVGFCRICSGLSTSINKNIVEVAKQISHNKVGMAYEVDKQGS